jgi:hypothetical protein
MALSVIGAGFGRTGTHSLNLALEAIGYGPCHHMADVMRSDQQKAFFRAAGRGEPVDWDEAYAGFVSAVDWPTAFFWRELADYYPDARIILTLRDPSKWFDSASETIFQTMGPDASPESFGVAVIRNKIFGGNLTDRAHVIAVMERCYAEIVATIPPERLLQYEVHEGWPKLCAFLGVPEPAEAFPLTNTTESFRANVLGQGRRPG